MPPKKLTEYLVPAPTWWFGTLPTYSASPAVALLTEIVHISDAVNQCVRHFPAKPKKPAEYTKDSLDSLYRLSAASLAAIMGHFETYQRFLFAGMFEATRLLPSFEIEKCIKRLNDRSEVTVNLSRVSAYRGQPASVGQLLSDSLTGWHSPDTVNERFKAVFPAVQMFSASDVEELRVLWQLRHSVVHTAGWLTQPDSQKVRQLRSLGGRPILFNEKFIKAVGRRLHPMVRDATKRLEAKFVALLPAGLPANEKKIVDDLFRVQSPRNSWLT